MLTIKPNDLLAPTYHEKSHVSISSFFLDRQEAQNNNSRSLREAISAIHSAEANRHRTHYLDTLRNEI